MELTTPFEHFQPGCVVTDAAGNAFVLLSRVFNQHSYDWVFAQSTGHMPEVLAAYTLTLLPARYGVIPPPTIAQRLAAFEAAAQPGAGFKNEHGRISTIIKRDSNVYVDPENGPWYHVLVFWKDAAPSEERMIWHTIGERTNNCEVTEKKHG